MDEVESLFSKDESDSVDATEASAAGAGEKKENAGADQGAAKNIEIKDVSDLSKLQAFSDIAVISKRFLPKTKRFEFYGAPALVLNDSFFYVFGLQGRAGYHFNERYGIEGSYTFLTPSPRDVTTGLERYRVKTTSFVTPVAFYGLAFKWSPIYGKVTWLNKKITPFDLYFSGGLGLTALQQGSSALTLQAGTGQIYAMSKKSAFRWDISWNMFSAVSEVDSSRQSALYHTLLLTLGWSWFYPEATYR